ncbi:DUF4411 family protein [Dermabacteraceae bacterium P7054]
MSYTLDSNILINMERLYPRDIFPSLWLSLEDLAGKGEACICEAVLRELKRGDDDLHTWAKNLDGLLCTTHQDEVLTVAAITQAHPEWVRGTQNDADPWVIAHGLKEQRIVVTEENLKGPNTPDRNQKIPNVALEHGVTTVKFFGFVKAQGWAF